MKTRNLKEIIELKEKLDLLSPYIKDDKIKNVVKWAEKDIAEIYEINEELKKNNLSKSILNKRTKKNKILRSGSIENDIINVYRFIEDELNYWRMLILQQKIKRCRKVDNNG